MKILYNKAVVDDGKQFVLTEAGYNNTPNNIKQTRSINQPVNEWSIFDKIVPLSWVKNGYVMEV